MLLYHSLRTTMVTLAIASAFSCGAPRATVPSPEACGQAPAAARHFQLADSMALVGRYDLVMVTTNRNSRQTTDAKLQLWANPSSRHRRLSQYGHYKGARPIAGVAMYADGKAYAGAAEQSTSPDSPATELLDSTLYLGSPDPTDAVYTDLRVQRISPAGFWGRFDSSNGFQITIDSTGQTLPEAQGFFCTIRSVDS